MCQTIINSDCVILNMLPYSVIHTIAWEMPGHDFVLEKKKEKWAGSLQCFYFQI
jgi:hypothetical protein